MQQPSKTAAAEVSPKEPDPAWQQTPGALSAVINNAGQVYRTHETWEMWYLSSETQVDQVGSLG